MAVNQYFEHSPTGDPSWRPLTVRLAGSVRSLTTANGLFSADGVDQATQVLLDSVPTLPATGDLLDLGCGWGPLALSMALQSPEARVWAVDVNERALEAVRRNAAALGLTSTIMAATPESVPANIEFSAIWSNPPIRIGKAALHTLLRSWLPRLAFDADAWLVVGKNLGADSLLNWMKSELAPGLDCTRATSRHSWRILHVHRPLPHS